MRNPAAEPGSVRGVAARLLVALMLPACAVAQKPSVTPVNLSAAGQSDPVGIEQDSLVFGWTLQSQPAAARNVRQTAYRILVASSEQTLHRQIGDLWDSGRVVSNTFWQLPYHGQALRSHRPYFWKAQAWNASGTLGPWSSPGHFTTGILSPAEWTARWISAPVADPAPLPVFRKQVSLSGNVAQALLSISGLGQYEIRINGRNATDTVLNPAWTNYRRTVSYDTYDVTSLVRPGANAFAVLLGNGMYNVEQTTGRYTKFTGSFGSLKLMLQLDVRFRDGSTRRVVSDGSWLSHGGPVTFSSIYGGEDDDGGALPAGWDMPGFQPAGWKAAVEVQGPGGVLQAGSAPPMIVAQIY